MAFKPTPCPDCPYPCNFAVTALTIEEHKQRYHIRCRECRDEWTEIDEENN